MAKYSYSTTIGEKDAAAIGTALPISSKQAIEICSFIRGKRLERAKAMLNGVLKEKTAVPFRRFTDGVGHRKGKIAAGRYPKNACGEILKLINSAQANAQFKGLSSSDLVVRHISAQRAATTWHYGRRRRKAKRTSVEVVLTESAAEKKEGEKEAKPEKPVEKPAQEKKEVKLEEKSEKKEEAKGKVVEKAKKPEKETKEKDQEKPKTEQKETEKAVEPQKEAKEKLAEPKKETKTKEAAAGQ